MRVVDLTDEDIGRMMWLQVNSQGEWSRVCFEGFASTPTSAAKAAKSGGTPYWILVLCSPGTPGAMGFRLHNGQLVTGFIVRSSTDVWFVDVEWAVTKEGEIVELSEKAA